LHITGAVRKGAPPGARLRHWIDGAAIAACLSSASSGARRCVRGPGRKNRSRSARMGTSGRTAGPTRGWMGAHAPITTVFVPGT